MSVNKYERTATFHQTRVTGDDPTELAEAVADFLTEAGSDSRWYHEDGDLILEYPMGDVLLPRDDVRTVRESVRVG